METLNASRFGIYQTDKFVKKQLVILVGRIEREQHEGSLLTNLTFWRISGLMANHQQYLAVYQAALDALSADLPHDERDRAEIDRAAGALLRVIGRRSAAQTLGSSDVPPVPTMPRASASMARPYDGLSVAEAAVEYLKTLPEKETKTVLEIVEHLKGRGFEFEAEKPETATYAALRRRAGNHGDIIRTVRGLWGLRDWYSQRDITSFRHKERTKAGMDAARARGVSFGKSWKINEAQAEEFKRLVADGATNKRLGEVFVVSTVAVTRYKAKLRNWEPGDPYPPTKSEPPDEDDGPLVRLVKE